MKTKYNNNIILEALKNKRSGERLNLSEVAKKMGCSRAWISLFLKGQVAKGTVIQAGKGEYSLPALQENSLPDATASQN